MSDANGLTKAWNRWRDRLEAQAGAAGPTLGAMVREVLELGDRSIRRLAAFAQFSAAAAKCVEVQSCSRDEFVGRLRRLEGWTGQSCSEEGEPGALDNTRHQASVAANILGKRFAELRLRAHMIISQAVDISGRSLQSVFEGVDARHSAEALEVFGKLIEKLVADFATASILSRVIACVEALCHFIDRNRKPRKDAEGAARIEAEARGYTFVLHQWWYLVDWLEQFVSAVAGTRIPDHSRRPGVA